MPSTPTVSVREWTDVVRRARLGKTTKYVALVMATYADYSDGTRIFPGNVRLAWDAEVDIKTVTKAIAELLRVGLIEAIKLSRTRGRGTEYRLTLGADLLEHVNIPSPAQATVAIHHTADRRRGDPHAHRPAGRIERVHNEPCAPPHGSHGPGQPDAMRTAGRVEAVSMRTVFDPPCAPPGGTPPSTDLDTTTTSHPDSDLRTAVTHTRATGPPQDPDSPPMPDRCEHGLTSRLRKDGKPTCAICRRESAKPSATVLQLRPRTAS